MDRDTSGKQPPNDEPGSPLPSRGESPTQAANDPAHWFDPGAQPPDELLEEHRAVLLSPGDVVGGRFEVVEQLGFGGMGAVYRVRDLELRNQERALKVMLPSLVKSEAAQERFTGEITVSQQLSHDSIVRVHDMGRDTRTGMRFFTMEHIKGVTLRRMLVDHGGRLPMDKAVGIARQLCGALSYAHRHTVHRDLKPQNIMVRPDGRIKVLDFGLAKLMTPGRMTRSSMALGTAYYQAPEQSVRLGDVDARADIYSLGVILYQLLTGEIPLGNVRAPSKVAAGIPRALDAVVMRCLEPKPEDRYQTAADLERAIVTAARPSRAKFLALAAAGLVASLAIAAGIVFLLKPKPEDVAERAVNEARQAQAAADAVDADTRADAQYRQAADGLQGAVAAFERDDYGTATSAARKAAAKFAEAKQSATEAQDKEETRRAAEKARDEAEQARAAARDAKAEERAEAELGKAEGLFAEAEAAFKAEEYKVARQKYVAARPAFQDAEKAALISGSIEEQLDAAKRAASLAKAEADNSQAATWAKADYEKAGALLVEAAKLGTTGEAVKAYQDAATAFGTASGKADEARTNQQRTAQARADAEKARSVAQEAETKAAAARAKRLAETKWNGAEAALKAAETQMAEDQYAEAQKGFADAASLFTDAAAAAGKWREILPAALRDRLGQAERHAQETADKAEGDPLVAKYEAGARDAALKRMKDVADLAPDVEAMIARYGDLAKDLDDAIERSRTTANTAARSEAEKAKGAFETQWGKLNKPEARQLLPSDYTALEKTAERARSEFDKEDWAASLQGFSAVSDSLEKLAENLAHTRTLKENADKAKAGYTALVSSNAAAKVREKFPSEHGEVTTAAARAEQQYKASQWKQSSATFGEARRKLEDLIKSIPPPPPPKYPEMVALPGGAFTMGSDESSDEQPPHRVTLSAFQISRYEVTASQFCEFLNEGGRQAGRWVSLDAACTIQYRNGEYLPRSGRAWYPANGVSWEGAFEYAKWLSSRTGDSYALPTEAQWEFAARGAEGRRYPWGDSPPTPERARYGVDMRDLVAVDDLPGGATPGTGLHHMAGNVWEWCEDAYSPSFYEKSPSENPCNRSVSTKSRALRGGGADSPASLLRASARRGHSKEEQSGCLGFRVVRND